jgi:hypothetical protein
MASPLRHFCSHAIALTAPLKPLVRRQAEGGLLRSCKISLRTAGYDASMIHPDGNGVGPLARALLVGIGFRREVSLADLPFICYLR